MERPKELTPEDLVVIVDTREQMPLDLSPLRTTVGTLVTGDYSLQAMPSAVAIERKSEGDLLACCGRERERFDREVQRLLAYPTRVLLVESTWARIEAGEWQSKLTPNQVLGSLLGWIAAGLPVVMAGDHARAGRFAARILYTVARRRWRELRQLISSREEMPR